MSKFNALQDIRLKYKNQFYFSILTKKMKTEIKKERFIKALKNEIPRNKFIKVVYYICLENYKEI